MRQRLTVYDDGNPRHVLVRGASGLLDKHGVPARWAPIRRCHELRRERLPDVLAAAQEANYHVTMRTGPPA